MREHPCGCRTEWFEDPDALCMPTLVVYPCDACRAQARAAVARRARASLN